MSDQSKTLREASGEVSIDFVSEEDHPIPKSKQAQEAALKAAYALADAGSFKGDLRQGLIMAINACKALAAEARALKNALDAANQLARGEDRYDASTAGVDRCAGCKRYPIDCGPLSPIGYCAGCRSEGRHRRVEPEGY